MTATAPRRFPLPLLWGVRLIDGQLLRLNAGRPEPLHEDERASIAFAYLWRRKGVPCASTVSPDGIETCWSIGAPCAACGFVLRVDCGGGTACWNCEG
jgi:hypothetical protein